MTGRPSLLTRELHAEFVQLVGEGHSYRTCCESVGIDQKTFRRWMAWGEGRFDYDKATPAPEDTAPHSLFRLEVTRARSAAKRSALANIRAAAIREKNPDWKADAWFLEHCFGDEFSGKQKVELSGEVTQRSIVLHRPGDDAKAPGEPDDAGSTEG